MRIFSLHNSSFLLGVSSSWTLPLFLHSFSFSIWLLVFDTRDQCCHSLHCRGSQSLYLYHVSCLHCCQKNIGVTWIFDQSRIYWCHRTLEILEEICCTFYFTIKKGEMILRTKNAFSLQIMLENQYKNVDLY